MLFPPRPENIPIVSVSIGDTLQNGGSIISVLDPTFPIALKTDNKYAFIINDSQKACINTTNFDAQLVVNTDSSLNPALRLTYQENKYFNIFVNSDGDAIFDVSRRISVLKDFNVENHDGVTSGLRLGGVLVRVSASELNYLDVIQGVADTSKALVLNSSKNISGINNLSATTLTGQLTTASQPLIDTLNNINIQGNLQLNGSLMDVTIDQLRYLKMGAIGTAYPSKALVVDINKNITGINNITANNLIGVVVTGIQPNITTLDNLNSITNTGLTSLRNTSIQGTLSINSTTLAIDGDGAFSITTPSRIRLSGTVQILNHTGTNGLMLGTTLVTVTGSQINKLGITTDGVAEGNKVLIVDNNRSISNLVDIFATRFTGLIQTPYQPNINKVDILDINNHNGVTGLFLGGTLVTASAIQLNRTDVTPGSAIALKCLVTDVDNKIIGLSSISSGSIFGIIQTTYQPSITRVDTLNITNHNGTTTGLSLGGTLVRPTATQINKLDVAADGVVESNKVVIADGLRNISSVNALSAVNISGTILTPLQPNISSVNSLDVVNHNGSTGLKLNGILVTSSAIQLNRVNVAAGIGEINKALILDSDGSIQNINVFGANSIIGTISTPLQPNIQFVNILDILNHNGGSLGLKLNGVLITSTAFQLNYTNVTAGTASGVKALVLDSNLDIQGINTIRSNSYYGTIQTGVQPNISSVSRLNISSHDGNTEGLSLGGILVTADANQINYLDVTAGVAGFNKAMVLDSTKSITGINTLTANIINGSIVTEYQTGIKSVTTLDIVNHNGIEGLSLAGVVVTSSANELNRVDVTAGYASANKALILDGSGNIQDINSLTATTLNGMIATSHQPSISSVNTLNIVNHDGGSSGLRLNNILVSSTASQLNYCSVNPGTATSLRSLVTNEFNSITGINSLSATRLIAQQLQLTGVISNFNTGAVVVRSYSFTDFVGRLIDTTLITSLSFINLQPGDVTSGFSSKIIGYILPPVSETYTFYVSCDDRVRLWVNDTELLHSWIPQVGYRISSQIFLNANQWVPIYIEYQCDVGSSAIFVMEWASSSVTRAVIPSTRLAWDNDAPSNTSKHRTKNELVIYNTSTAVSNKATLTVDPSGDLTIDASGNDVIFGSLDNVNIPAHDGNSAGLYLGGVLVRPTAFELNYLKVNPGTVGPTQAIVTDASKSIVGLNSLTATSVACTNLTAGSFTISDLSLSGPLSNYSTGSLMIRQLTGSDNTGRVVNVATITDINFTSYNPRDLTGNYCLDITGYVLPSVTELYRFYSISNGRVRIWVANTLILNSWDVASGTEIVSSQIQLTAAQWTPIYIQYQNLNTPTSSLSVRWGSTTVVKSFINNAFMSWDNTKLDANRKVVSPDSMVVYSGASGVTAVQSGGLYVDGNGNMSLACTSTTVSVASSNNFNVATHNGTIGLQLSGTLVVATATEINRLSGVTPGTVIGGKVVVLDNSKNLSGVNDLTATSLYGQVRTSAQPFITSFGTLSSTLTTNSDIILGSTNKIRLVTDSTTCYIQSGQDSVDSSCDLLFGNINSTSPTRRMMLKASGFLGVQTILPVRTLSINGAGSQYCMRLVNNNNAGTETIFCDIGVDTSSRVRFSGNILLDASAPSITATNPIAINTTTVQISSTNTDMPLELGSRSFTVSTAMGFLNSEGSVGKVIPSGSSFSMRTTGSILVGGTVCVNSDYRIKTDIESLTTDECLNFVMKSKPVQFKYKNDNRLHLGLIAQDVAKSKYSNIVQATPDANIQEEKDEDGFVSPEGYVLNIAYEEIIPILLNTCKHLNTKIDEQAELIKILMAKLNL